MKYSEQVLAEVHKNKSSNNEGLVKMSNRCGCFSCLKIFPAKKTVLGVYGTEASCPHCGIDSIIPDCGVELDPQLLIEMETNYFGIYSGEKEVMVS